MNEALHSYAQQQTATGGGAVSNGANVGAGAGLVFKQVVGTNLEFRSIATDGFLPVTTVGDTVVIGKNTEFVQLTKSTDQVVAGGGGNVKVTFDGSIGDATMFDDANDTIVIPTTGTYMIGYFTYGENFTNSTGSTSRIVINGGGVPRLVDRADNISSGGGATKGFSMFELTAADTIELQVQPLGPVAPGAYSFDVQGSPAEGSAGLETILYCQRIS